MSDNNAPLRAASVNLVGGSVLTRDLLTTVLNEAGISVAAEAAISNVSIPNPDEITIVIAEDKDASAILTEVLYRHTIVVVDLDNDDAVVDLILDGADAVLGFQATAQEIAQAVRTVAGGGSVVTPGPARRLVELARAGKVNASPERALLTSRELDILMSIGRGESVKQTALTLGISAKTVENLQSRLFRKLNVRNRAQAFAQAHSMGLLPLPARKEGAAR